jgi:hypothetical protein
MLLKIKDYTFAHSHLGYCSDYQKSEKFNWDRTDAEKGEIVVYTDGRLLESKDPSTSVAWIIEPIEIAPQVYNYIVNNEHMFKKIYTHEKTLLDLNSKYEFVPFGCCWIDKKDQNIYQKNKNLSIISSHKNETSGHKLRHDVIQKFGSMMDVYGRGYNPIDYKLTALKDYRYSIVIENCKRDYWFTEKLIDCLITGTIPIYWGCPSIGDFFDTRGFIIFENVEELSDILANISEDTWISKLEYIKHNYKKAQNYLLPDDHVYDKIKCL